MGKKKGNKSGGHDEPPTDVSRSKKKRNKKVQASKEQHFELKKKKKENLDKLRLQEHPKRRRHKPVGKNVDEPVDIHHPSPDVDSDSDVASTESTYISIKESSTDDNPTKVSRTTLIRSVSEDDTPWMKPGHRYRLPNVFLCLHDEILDFVTFLSPTPEEVKARKALVKTMQDLVASLWDGASLSAFGSLFTEMYLPSSDIDMVVLDGPSGKEPLYTLAQRLEDLGIVSFLEVVDSARIPIVKFVHTESGLSVDVSFGVTSGFATGDLVKGYQEKFPAFRPLTLVLKYFLQQRGLNETFKGGVGSFLLQLMVVSFLQHKNRNSSYSNSMQDLGHLLVDFFDLYGNVFNSTDLTISVRDGGAYVMKESRNWKNYQRPDLLSMENPHDTNHDVGANSYEVRRVFKVFSHAAKVLKAEICHRGSVDMHHDDYGTSILERIIAKDVLLQDRVGPDTFGFAMRKPDMEALRHQGKLHRRH
ncbi:hypothetical protein DYB32_004013 [Aphanomyces invadans]|uniref:polynucleotide adenylyltransferase n=1 Tax=Aphanomyces invadans TaxID=157072 RepID=A0A418AYW8_9STRA|nr:hypothetical protein DYB32_004013 [Aphanomyces invadans]